MNDQSDDGITSSRDKDIALERYGLILQTMEYEGSVFWNRSMLYLTGHTLLLGFVLTAVPKSQEEMRWARLAAVGFVCVAGIMLSYLWKQALVAGLYWLIHWRNLLRTLEPEAFGPHLVHRPFPEKPGYVSATGIARQTSTLFFVLWCAATALTFAMALVKCGGYVLL